MGPKFTAEISGEKEPRFQIDEESDRWLMQTQEGAIYGPVSRFDLDQWESEGRLSAVCLVQRAGQSHWQSALILYPHLAGASPAPVTSKNPPRDPRAHVGTNRRVAPGPMIQRGNNGPAVLAMGILGVIMFAFPVFAMIAWAMGASEMRAIQRGEARSEGQLLVKIGHILGLVGTCIGVLICLSCCVAFRR